MRLNLPLRLASGQAGPHALLQPRDHVRHGFLSLLTLQEGPLVEFLRWCMAPAPKMRWPHAGTPPQEVLIPRKFLAVLGTGSQQSALAYLAVLARACACSSLYYIILYYIILYYIILYYIILLYCILL